MSNFLDNLAPVFSSTEEYSIGDKFFYNKMLYKVIANFSGDFNASKVEPLYLTDLLVGTDTFSDDIDYLADEYDIATSYNKDDIVDKDGNIYKCKESTSGVWNASKWEQMYFIDLPNLEASESDDIRYIAPLYESSETYNTDDTVIYEGELYQCKEDEVTGTWNTSKWDRVNLVEVGELNSNLGGFVEGTFTSTSSYQEVVLGFKPKKLFITLHVNTDKGLNYTYSPSGSYTRLVGVYVVDGAGNSYYNDTQTSGIITDNGFKIKFDSVFAGYTVNYVALR